MSNQTEMVKALQRVLANTYALYLKTHNYHWNIKGADFPQYHKLLEEHYQNLAQAVDEIAESIVMLGYKAPGSFSKFLDLQEILEGDENKETNAMLAELSHDHQKLEVIATEAVEVAEEAKDIVIVDLLTQRAAAHRKDAWMLKESSN